MARKAAPHHTEVPELVEAELGAVDPELEDHSDEEGEDQIDPLFRMLREDPYGRWPAGKEPLRAVGIRHLWGDFSSTLLLRQARIEVEPGVLPRPRFDRALRDVWDLRFLGRWNATWSGTRLKELSLDCFSDEWDEVIRLVLDPEDPVDLLVAYNASFPGIWGLDLVAEDMTARNAHDETYGHRVSARDPRLAMQIAARYPGIAEHTAWMEKEIYRPSELTTDESVLMMVESFGGTGTSLANEYAPGAELTANGTYMAAFAAMHGGSAEPPPVPFREPVAATLDAYTLIAAPALGEIREADLMTVPPEMVAALAAHVTFPDAISAIRRASPERLPLWLDFTSSTGEPLRYRRVGAPDQPLYGVMVFDYEDDDVPGAPVRIVAPVGRTAGLIERPLPFCALGIGPDDQWRFPIPKNMISLLTAHRGGVAIRHVRTPYDLHGTKPEITETEIAREIAGYVARTTEWILARVGAVLSGLDDGLLLLEKIEHSDRSYRLVLKPPTKLIERAARDLEAPVLVERLRELGSLRRVANAENADVVAVREALDRAGVDPDQVRRDEVMQRFRRSGSVETVVAELHIFRSDVERFLAEAGVEWNETAVPHDVTDRDVLAAINAYREEGTLDGAGARLGVSSETIRRRLHRAGLNTFEIVTDARRKAAKDAVAAWKAERHSLAGAARRLGLDPRTVKERLREAGVSPRAIGADKGERAAEARKLDAIVDSPRQVAALMGISVSTVRRYLEDGEAPRRAGRPRVSDGALYQAKLAHAEHGSIRAAARALGMSVGGFNYRLQLARARDVGPERNLKNNLPTIAASGRTDAKEK